jgi:hypothetical protein
MGLLNVNSDVAKEAVKGLSTSPILLIIAVLNVVMILGVGWASSNAREERRELREQENAIVKVLTEQCADQRGRGGRSVPSFPP